MTETTDATPTEANGALDGTDETGAAPDAAALEDADAGFTPTDEVADDVKPGRPAIVRRVVCPDCRGLVEVLGAPNDQNRVHVQCGACGRQAYIPFKAPVGGARA